MNGQDQQNVEGPNYKQPGIVPYNEANHRPMSLRWVVCWSRVSFSAGVLLWLGRPATWGHTRHRVFWNHGTRPDWNQGGLERCLRDELASPQQPQSKTPIGDMREADGERANCKEEAANVGKVSCAKCGRWILPETARRTGGFCAPCEEVTAGKGESGSRSVRKPSRVSATQLGFIRSAEKGRHDEIVNATAHSRNLSGCAWGCSRQSEQILGKWQSADGRQTYEFRSDGKYEHKAPGPGVVESLGPYRIDKNRLYLTTKMPSYGGQWEDQTSASEFHVEGDVLTLNGVKAHPGQEVGRTRLLARGPATTFSHHGR